MNSKQFHAVMSESKFVSVCSSAWPLRAFWLPVSGALHCSEWQKKKKYVRAIISLTAFCMSRLERSSCSGSLRFSEHRMQMQTASTHDDTLMGLFTDTLIINVCYLTGSFLCLLNAASTESTVD